MELWNKVSCLSIIFLHFHTVHSSLVATERATSILSRRLTLAEPNTKDVTPQCNLEKSKPYGNLERGQHPSLLIIGVEKGGTTDLYEWLLQGKPSMFNVPETKELHELARAKFNQSTYLQRLNVSGPHPFTLEATAAYVYNENVWKNVRQQLGAMPHVLLMLRDPLSRIRSKWNYRHQAGHHYQGSLLRDILAFELNQLQTPVFESMLRIAVTDPDSSQALVHLGNISVALKAKFEEAGLTEGTHYMRSELPLLLQSLYFPIVRYWDHIIEGCGKFLVVRSETYYAERLQVLNEAIMPFLFYDSIPAFNFRGNVNEVMNRFAYINASVIPTSLACRIHEFYKPYNQMLMDLLASSNKTYVFPETSNSSWWPLPKQCTHNSGAKLPAFL